MSSLENRNCVLDTFFAVETTLLQEFDQFVLDCKDFTDQFYTHYQKQPESVASKLAFWSNRKQGSRLQKLFNSLNKREEEFDAQLRSIMDESLTNVSSLSLQATHLKSRLLSCIDFNRKEMDSLGVQMTELQRLSFELLAGDKDTKEILHFVNEVIVQGEAQLERNLIYFPVESDPGDVVGFSTRDRSLVIRRLHMIREVQSQTSQTFSEVLEMYKKHQGILRICQASHNLLREIPPDVLYNLKYDCGKFVSEGASRSCHMRCIGSPRAVLVGAQVHRDPSLSDKTNGHVVGALEKYFLQPEDSFKLSDPLNLQSTNSNTAEIFYDNSRGSDSLKRTGAGISTEPIQLSPEWEEKRGREKKTAMTETQSKLCILPRTNLPQLNDISVAAPNNICDAVDRSSSYTAMSSSGKSKAASCISNGCGSEESSSCASPRYKDGKFFHSNTCYTAVSGSNNRRGIGDLELLGHGLEADAKVQEEGGAVTEEKDKEISYDHTQCCDCSVVDDLGRDCFTRLSAMHRKAAESFSRLEVLLEIREDLININMALRARKTF